MKKSIKRFIAIILSCLILCNICCTYANAETKNEYSDCKESIFIDGVEYTYSISDEFDIIIEGESDISEAYCILNKNGEAKITIDNDNNYSKDEEYEVKINELSQNSIDMQAYKDDELYKEYDSIEDIIEDEYDGQSASVGILMLEAGKILISLGAVLEALVTAGLAIIIAGITYIVAVKVYARVQAATAEKRKKAQRYYYPATVWKGQVVISPKGIAKNKAVARVKANLSVYSFTSSMARAVISQAGYKYGPVGKLGEINKKRYKGNAYFYHYHKANSNYVPVHAGGFHSFYGAPVAGTL